MDEIAEIILGWRNGGFWPWKAWYSVLRKLINNEDANDKSQDKKMYDLIWTLESSCYLFRGRKTEGAGASSRTFQRCRWEMVVSEPRVETSIWREVGVWTGPCCWVGRGKKGDDRSLGCTYADIQRGETGWMLVLPQDLKQDYWLCTWSHQREASGRELWI